MYGASAEGVYLMQQNGEGIQEVVIAALKDMHHADQTAAHIPANLHLHTQNMAMCTMVAILQPRHILMSQPILCQ